MGALYVTEGATLGGRLLARGLDRLLGAGEARGRRFLLAGHRPGAPGLARRARGDRPLRGIARGAWPA